MFGYIRINKMDLTFREYEHYKAYYCGMCKYLKRNHTEISRLSINYDITFLILILSSVYQPKAEVFYEKCIVDPIKKKKHIINEVTEYASSMNILLTYYKLEDDVNDEGRFKDKALRSMYKKSFDTAFSKYPDKAEKIKKCLDELSKLEKEDSKNIDEVSNTFGRLMEEVFSYKEDEYSEKLKRIGFNMGKYIYILDAYEDLDEDIEKNRYNPFKGLESSKEDVKPRVEKLLEICLSNLERAVFDLDIKVNRGIIDNIIYSGIYLRYKGLMNGVDNRKNQV